MECVSLIEMNRSRYPNCHEKNDHDGCNALGEMAGRNENYYPVVRDIEKPQQ